MGKTATVSETEKKHDIVYFFAVIVGKTDFNTQKPVLEKNTLKAPKNSITLNPINFLGEKKICSLGFHRIDFY